MEIKPMSNRPSMPPPPSHPQTRASLLKHLPTPPLRSTTLCNRRLFTRSHFLPGQILNAPLHAPNVDTKIRQPFVTSTVCGPVFSKRRYFVVLWKYLDRLVCLPVYSRVQGHRGCEYVGVTGVGDGVWDGVALGDGNVEAQGKQGVEGDKRNGVLYVEAAQGWGGKIWRSYVDLAFPVGLDIKEDITHTCGFLDGTSYLKLVRLFRERERVALEESLACEEFRGLKVGEVEVYTPSESAGLPSSDAADGKAKVKGRKGRSERFEEKKKVVGQRRLEKKREVEKRRMEKTVRKKEKRKAAKGTTKKDKSGSGKGRGSEKSSKESIGSPKKSGVTKWRVMPTRKAKARVDYAKGTE